MLRYQGQDFIWIEWDELTQYSTLFAYDYMRSRLRTTDSTIPLCIRATTNPGGPGHGWVRKTFLYTAPPNTPFPETDLDTGKILTYPDSHEFAGQPLFMRKFIPSKLSDNSYQAEGMLIESLQKILGSTETEASIDVSTIPVNDGKDPVFACTSLLTRGYEPHNSG